MYIQFSKALLLSFKAEYEPYETEIVQLSQSVRDEVLVASEQAQKLEHELQAKERSKDSRSRELLVRIRDSYQRSSEEDRAWRAEIIRRRFEKEKMNTLLILSTYDYQKTYKQILKGCVPGTSLWITECPEYLAWVHGPLKTLRFSGKCKFRCHSPH